VNGILVRRKPELSGKGLPAKACLKMTEVEDAKARWSKIRRRGEW
jgi:hypothetical protein